MKMLDENEEIKENKASEQVDTMPHKETIEESPKEAPKVEKTIDDWEITDLPSKFRLYPSGTKIYGRRLSVKEVKRLAQMNADNMEDIMQDVLKSAVKGINIEDLYDADKLYIILWLRANTYREPNYSMSFFCDKCNKVSDYTFQLDNLKINYLEENFNLKFKLSNGTEIVRKFLQVKDTNKILKFKERYPEMDIDEEMLEQACCIEFINNEHLDLMNKYLYISEKMDAPTYSQLITEFRKYDFGISRNLDVTCNKCKEESITGLVFREEFFIPKYRV